jgi:anti-sigma factor RsiW
VIVRCRDVIERLDRLAAGGLDARERREVERHLESCAGCAGLARALGEDAQDLPEIDLVASVLERTSGSPCASAWERLPGWVDAELGETDAALVRSHVEGCAGCAALAGALARLREELPLLAEPRLDDRFTTDVLRRTSRSSAPVTAQAPLRDRLREWIQGLARRPRFALEASYVGGVLLFLVFGTPGSPLAGVSERAMRLAKVNPVVELREPGSRLQSRVSAGVESAWRTTGEPIVTEFAEFGERTVDRIGEDLGTLWRQVASEQENDATPPDAKAPGSTEATEQGDGS